MLGRMTASLASHRWETTSSHVTSDGWVRYQQCACGLIRVLLNTEAIGVAVTSNRRHPESPAR
jgi:hypothetical protein